MYIPRGIYNPLYIKPLSKEYIDRRTRLWYNGSMEKTALNTNRDSKDILARLLATENICVEHQPVPTAYFDTVERRLVLPVWENMDNDLYDMLVGHEVGHALFTPHGNEFTKAAINRIDAGAPDSRVMPYLNVVEDVRIEKAIKDKFPGLRRNFVKAYKGLVDSDFFGIADKDVNEMSLIDRVNVHYKVGNHVDVSFTPEEQVIVDQIDQVTTWEEMVDAAEALYSLSKEQKQQEQQQEQPDDRVEAGADGDHLDNDGQSSSAAEGEGDQSDQTENTSGNGEEQGDDSGHSMEDDTDDGQSADSQQGEPSTDIENGGGNQHVDQMVDMSDLPDECETQKSMDNAIGKMTNQHDDRRRIYITMPKPDLDTIVVPVDKVMDDFRKHLASDRFVSYRNDYLNACYSIFTSFQKDASKTVNKMVQQFEMKKAADQYKRRAITDSGVLDTIKMVNYRWSDDVFLKNTVVPGAKSHGMVMFIDWSGSMSDKMCDTLKQLMTLIMFCKKVNIPYDVYAFTSNYEYLSAESTATSRSYKDGDGIIGDVRLLNLMSSSMKNRDWTEMMTYITMLTNAHAHSSDKHFNDQYRVVPRGYHLGCTPLDDAIVCAATIAKEFKDTYKTQIVNTIFLTDGCTSTSPLGSGYYNSGYYYKNDERTYMDGVPVLRGKHNKIFNNHKSTTDNLLEWFTAETGIPVLGIYVCRDRELYYLSNDITDKMFEKFKSDKSLVLEDFGGYKSMYVINPMSKKKVKGVDDLDQGVKPVMVKNAMVREAKARKVQQRIMDTFVDNISKETV